MKRKKTSRFRRARRWMRYRPRKHDKRMPLSVGVGLAASIMAPAAPGWASAFDSIRNGDMQGAAAGFIRSWTGIYGIDGKEPIGINVMATLNPFNMAEAPAWKATFWTAIIAKVIKSAVHVDPIGKIPVVNKYVKFS